MTTLEALKASIAKWEANLVAKNPDEVRVTGKNCPLCQLFAGDAREVYDCGECPVRLRTGRNSCHETPYYKVTSKLRLWKQDSWYEQDTRNAMQEEVDFLRSLLPAE